MTPNGDVGLQETSTRQAGRLRWRQWHWGSGDPERNRAAEKQLAVGQDDAALRLRPPDAASVHAQYDRAAPGSAARSALTRPRRHASQPTPSSPLVTFRPRIARCPSASSAAAARACTPMSDGSCVSDNVNVVGQSGSFPTQPAAYALGRA